MKIVNDPHIIVFNDPRYACKRNIEIVLSDNNYLTFFEGESLALTKSEDGRFFIGDGLGCVEITAMHDLERFLESVFKASFEIEDEDGEKFMYATEDLTECDLISTIPINSIVIDKDKAITVKSINFI